MSAVQQIDMFSEGRSLHDWASFKDDLDLMSLPFFSPEHKARFEPLEFERITTGPRGRRIYLKVSPGEFGLAKVFDRDILIYVRTLLMDNLARGNPATKTVRFPVYDFLRATDRHTSGREYTAFHDALLRLKTTSVLTNITTSDEIEDTGDGFINNFKIKKRATTNGAEVMAACEITVSDWMFGLMTVTSRSLTIDRRYFSLKGGLERMLYGIVRKHVGDQPEGWNVAVENLREMCGVKRELRKFRYDLAKIVAKGLPGYTLELTKDHRPPAVALVGAPLSRFTGKDYLVARPIRALPVR